MELVLQEAFQLLVLTRILIRRESQYKGATDVTCALGPDRRAAQSAEMSPTSSDAGCPSERRHGAVAASLLSRREASGNWFWGDVSRRRLSAEISATAEVIGISVGLVTW